MPHAKQYSNSKQKIPLHNHNKIVESLPRELTSNFGKCILCSLHGSDKIRRSKYKAEKFTKIYKRVRYDTNLKTSLYFDLKYSQFSLMIMSDSLLIWCTKPWFDSKMNFYLVNVIRLSKSYRSAFCITLWSLGTVPFVHWTFVEWCTSCHFQWLLLPMVFGHLFHCIKFVCVSRFLFSSIFDWFRLLCISVAKHCIQNKMARKFTLARSTENWFSFSRSSLDHRTYFNETSQVSVK